MKRRFRRAGSIIAVSGGVAQELVHCFGVAPESVATIYNPILGADVGRRCAVEVEHGWLGPRVERAAPVIVGAGRLVPAKDFPNLIRAAAIIRRDRPCRVLILGEGPARADLEALAESLGIRDAVDLPGWVDDPMPYMERADLFVLSSRNEGLGNVLVEAIGAGTPVVSTDCPNGPREILCDGELGPLVPPGDPQALAEGVVATLEDPPDRDRLREGASRFFIDVVAESYLELMGIEPDGATSPPK